MYQEQESNTASSNMGQGALVVHVTTARGAIPLEGAQVHVRNYDAEGSEGRGDVIRSVVSGRDGNTPVIPLPAPARVESLKPNGNAIPPFASYLVEVILEGYFQQNYIKVPIFDGITAVQNARIIPIAEFDAKDPFYTQQNIFEEYENPDL